MLARAYNKKKKLYHFLSTIKVNEHYFKKAWCICLWKNEISLIIPTIIDGKIYKNSCRFDDKKVVRPFMFLIIYISMLLIVAYKH